MSSEVIASLVKILAGIALSAASASVGVPIETGGARVVVRLTVNGEGPFPLVLSAQSGPLVLSESLIERIGLRGETGSPSLARIEIGDLALEDVPVRPLEKQGPVLEMASTSGFLPLGLLDRFLVTVDYGSNLLMIEEGELPPEDGVTIVPLGLGADGDFTVPVQIDGLKVTTRLLLGRSQSLTMGLGYSERLPLLTNREIVGDIRTPEGSVNLIRARFSGPVRIGRQDLFVLSILFDPLEPEASLGSVAFRDHAITLDQSNRRLRIVRSDGEGG